MNLDFLIFPSPKSSYQHSYLEGELIWIPKDEKKNLIHNRFSLSKESITCCGDANVDQENLYQDPSNRFNNLNYSYIGFKNSSINLIQEDKENIKNLKKVNFNQNLKPLKSHNISYQNVSLNQAKDKSLCLFKINTLKRKPSNKKTIPCLYLPCKQNSNKLLIYFHANGEDIYITRNLLNEMRNILKINILAPEYPNYGIYKSNQEIASTIERDSLSIYDYMNQKVGFDQSNIILCGRSIGTGPSCYIASKRKPRAQVLISSFLSVKEAVKSYAGQFFSLFINERFNNKNLMKQIICPTMYIHGKNDNVIPSNHSQELFNISKKINRNSEFQLRKDMSHVEFDYNQDIILPTKKFLTKLNFFHN